MTFAIDPGATGTGWAKDLCGRLEWGTESFALKRGSTEAARWKRFRDWLKRHLECVPTEDLIVVYELQNNFNRGNASSGEVAKIFVALLLEYCERRGIACEAVHNGALKSFAIPALPRPKKGEPKNPPLDRGKEAMMAAARRKLLGGVSGSTDALLDYQDRVATLTEHEADALWLYWKAVEKP